MISPSDAARAMNLARPLRDLTCEVCGAPYQTRQTPSRFCSKSCGNKATNERRRERRHAAKEGGNQ